MGKYTTKPKTTPLFDVTHGVRTRAKSLALSSDAAYLDLRSRRLQKTMHPLNSPTVRHSCGKKHLEIRQHEPDNLIEQGGQGLGNEGSFGDNDLDFQLRESLMRPTDAICTLASSSKQRYPRPSTQNPLVISGHELEDIFTREEQAIQRRFIEKYNFDIVKDSPLSGRYEWVAVRP